VYLIIVNILTYYICILTFFTFIILLYRHAIQLSPNSGQPYNQLALLEASRGDSLSTVFYYMRSINVRHPFLAAVNNLNFTLNKYISSR